MRYVILAAMLIGIAGAVPATNPTSLGLESDLRAAQSSLADSKAKAAARFEAGPGKAMDADVAAKLAALQNARENGTPQERLDASSACVSAKGSADKARAAAISADDSVLKIERAIGIIADELPKIRAQEAAAKVDAEIARTPAITIRMLETVGEKYESKRIRMFGTFMGTDTDSVDLLPCVTLSSNGLVSVIDSSQLKTWLDIKVRDQDQGFTTHIFATKKEWADALLAMKAGAPIQISGVVVKLDQAGWYGIICSDVKALGELPKEN